MILLLHQNKTDMNARGHIGTELLNKAETTISVTKDAKTGIFTIACEMSRDISFDDFGFTIGSDGKLEPVTLTDKVSSKSTKLETVSDAKHIEVIGKMFSSETTYNYEDLVTEISHRFGVGVSASKKYASLYVDKAWLTKEKAGKETNYHISFLNMN
jgi:hypothetical protein